MTHKNAEVIKAWAEGRVIQWQAAVDCWMDYDHGNKYSLGPWDNRASCNWRIKPEVKPDMVVFAVVSIHACTIGPGQFPTDNLRLTFDGAQRVSSRVQR